MLRASDVIREKGSEYEDDAVINRPYKEGGSKSPLGYASHAHAFGPEDAAPVSHKTARKGHNNNCELGY